MKQLTLSILVLCSFPAESSHAIEVQCPARIDMQPAQLKETPDGWHSAQTATSLPVWSVDVSVGPPEKRAILKPEVLNKQGGKVSKWTFVEAENEQGLWLSCSYGGSPVVLTKELPKKLSSCEAHERVLQDHEWKLVTTCR